MTTFEKGWPVWREHEGRRFTNHTWDPGGATKFGITLRSAQAAQGIDFDVDKDGDIDAIDIRLLDEPTAKEFYFQWFYRYKYDQIIDSQVAIKVMDISINLGPRGINKKGVIYGAHILVQRAVNKCGYALLLDGFLGQFSLAAINDCDPRELILELCFLQAEHYRAWLDKDPSRDVARNGLLNRAAWPFVPNGYIS